MSLAPPAGRPGVAVAAGATKGRLARSIGAGRWLGRLALIALGLLLPLLALEIALRQFGPIIPGNYQTGSYLTSHPVYGSFHVVNFAGWIRTPEYVAHLRTNSIGLRDRELAVPKPAGTYRILVLGDSFVEGEGVSDGQPFAEVMERALNALPPRDGRPERYEVVNAGVGGWGPAEEFLWLRNEGLALQPDLVVLQLYLGNDVWDTGCRIPGQHDTESKVCFHLDGAGRLYQDELHPRPVRQYDDLRGWLRQDLMLFNVLETGVLQKRDSAALDRGSTTFWQRNKAVYARSWSRSERPAWEEAWQVVDSLAGAMKRETESSGARFALTVVPIILQVYPDEWSQAVAENRLDPRQWDLEGPHRRLAEIARGLDAPYLDYTPALRQEAAAGSTRLYYHMNRHLTVAGHQAVARRLQDFLAGEGMLP